VAVHQGWWPLPSTLSLLKKVKTLKSLLIIFPHIQMIFKLAQINVSGIKTKNNSTLLNMLLFKKHNSICSHTDNDFTSKNFGELY